MIEILLSIALLIFILFVPGVLLNLVIFKDQRLIEGIVMSVGLNFVFLVLQAFLLTGLGALINSPGLTATNVWIHTLLTCGILTILIVVRYSQKQ